MGLFQRLFGRASQADTKSHETVKQVSPSPPVEEWEAIPAYIPADEADYPLVSVIATAIAAGDHPECHFVVKRILQRNPEALKLSLIAASIAAGESTDCQLAVKHIYQKKNS